MVRTYMGLKRQIWERDHELTYTILSRFQFQDVTGNKLIKKMLLPERITWNSSD